MTDCTYKGVLLLQKKVDDLNGHFYLKEKLEKNPKTVEK